MSAGSKSELHTPHETPARNTSQRHAAVRIFGSRAFVVASLALVVLGGMIARLNHIGKSLWTPEAWVANSALMPSLRQMFYYDAWLQTTPPLFLVVLRETVRIAGLSTYSLRAVPLVFAGLSLILAAYLARATLRPSFAVLFTSLVALSPPAVVFAKEVKQFSGDLFGSTLILLVLWKYVEQPSQRRYLFVLSTFAGCMLLSYTAVFFLPLAGWVLLTTDTMGEMEGVHKRTLLARLAIFSTITCVIGAIEYWFFVKPNSSPLLASYWQDGYPSLGQWRHLPKFYAENYFGMGIFFYLPIHAKDWLKEEVLSGGYLIMTGLALTAIATAAAIAVLWRDRHYRQILLFCLLPVCTLACLNALRLYPVSSRRLTLFLLPCASLLLVAVLQASLLKVGAKLSEVTRAYLAGLLAVSCVVVVLALGTHSDDWGNFWFEHEDTNNAVLFLRSNASPRDTVYIHASIAEPAKLYFAIQNWTPPDVRYGRTGWICCTRNVEPLLTDGASKQQYVLSDFKRVVGSSLSTRVWLMFTGRAGNWEDLGRNESEIVTRYLEEQHCHKEGEREFAHVLLMSYRCSANR